MTMRFGRRVGTEVVNMDRVEEGANANAVQHAKMSGARDALSPKGKVAQAADEERAGPLTTWETPPHCHQPLHCRKLCIGNSSPAASGPLSHFAKGLHRQHNINSGCVPCRTPSLTPPATRF